MVSSSNFGGYNGSSGYGGSTYGSPGIRRQAEAIRRRSGGVTQVRGAHENPEAPHPQNVMELLVEEEIEMQVHQLSSQQRMAIHVPQVMAYALNRLPSLYVTSERGWRRQWIEGKSAHQNEITQAVKQAIIAVQRDPLRTMGPLSEHLPEVAEVPMARLRKMLQEPHLSWSTLVPTIQKLLVQGKMDFPDEVALRQRRRASDRHASGRRASDRQASDRQAPDRQEEVTTQVQSVSSSEPTQIEVEGFDWDSHPLHQRGY